MTTDGSALRRDRLTHPGAVVIVPVDTVGVWMLRQYRPAVGAWLWELPAGLREPGESAAEAAARECSEEVGQRPGTLAHLGTLFSSPGIVDERIDVFAASALEEVGRRPDDHEERYAEVRRVHPRDLRRMIIEGEVSNAITIAALALAGQAPGVRPPVQ